MALSEQEGIPSLEEAHGSLNLVQLRSLCQAPDLHLEELQNLSLLRVCVCVCMFFLPILLPFWSHTCGQKSSFKYTITY